MKTNSLYKAVGFRLYFSDLGVCKGYFCKPILLTSFELRRKRTVESDGFYSFLDRRNAFTSNGSEVLS